MSPFKASGPAGTGPFARTGLVDPNAGYRADQLVRRRARRDSEADLAELRRLIDAYDAGHLDLEAFGWQVGSIGASFGARAARGDLASS
jgi:hypothetical protein